MFAKLNNPNSLFLKVKSLWRKMLLSCLSSLCVFGFFACTHNYQKKV
eukprot:UN17338